MIERERTDQIRTTGKGDDSDPIVRSLPDKFLGYLFDRLDPIGSLRPML